MRAQGSMFMPEDAVDAFKHNPDGSWTCIKETMIFGYGGIITIKPGMTFRKGEYQWGVDVAGVIEDRLAEEKP